MDIFAQKKLMIRIIIVLVVVNLLSIGALVWKGFMPPPRPDRETPAKPRDVSAILESELNLLPAQVDQIRNLRTLYINKEQELVTSIRIARDSMNEEMFKKGANEERIYFLARKIADNEYNMELLRFEQAKELKSICTPEQVEKFDRLMKEMRDYFRPDNKPNNQRQRNPPPKKRN